jgi:hypothetical protein
MKDSEWQVAQRFGLLAYSSKTRQGNKATERQKQVIKNDSAGSAGLS